MHINLFTDGGSRGNPGDSAIGAVLYDETGHTVAEISEYIGITTNNQAEYRALIAALECAKQLGATSVHAFADSELMVKQMKGVYRVKNAELAHRFMEAIALARNFSKITFTHVRREKNKAADALVNKALDAA